MEVESEQAGEGATDVNQGQGDRVEPAAFKVVGDPSAKEMQQEESDDEEENDEESGEEQEEGEEGDDEEDEDDGNVAKRVEYYLEKYGELYKCKICSRVVGGKKWHAKRHIRAHWNIRPFACTKCDAKFLRNDHLKRHVEKLRCQGLKDAASAGNPVVVVQEIRKPGIKTPTVSKRKSAAKKPDPEPKKVKKVTQRGQSKKQEKVKKVKAKKPRKK